MRRILAIALFSVCSLSAVRAADPAATPKAADARDNIVTTSHSMKLGAQTINYKAHAGTIVLRNDEGKARANFFVVAYVRDGVDPATRPVTFTFNGGPGSSSVWLHMGAFGPKRVVYADDMGNATRPPYRLTDNEATILDVSDLVFIDPVTTGFSRAIPHEDARKFHGVDADVESVGELIRLWTTRYGRWSSPKFLAGESYGTTRAAGLAGWLQSQGYYLNGVMLISSVLNFGTVRFDSGNDLPYILFLPTYTATSWYHKKLPQELQQLSLESVVAQAEEFALGDYASALIRGDRLPDTARQSVIQRLARFTGLTPEYIERTNLRIDIHRFDKELLRDQRRTVGRLDSRFTGIDLDAAGETPEFDPSYASIYGEYTGTFNDWVRRGLRFETDMPYEILTGKVRPWNYEQSQNRYLDVAETLRAAMSRNPHLRVLVANGYYDLATPFAATHYTFSRMQLDPSLRDNVTMTYYPSGHMMYVEKDSRLQLRDDVLAFIRASTSN
ncbi:MAG TPA: peptidase S10 [Thermoanaerobaculia bacterium]